MIIKNLSGEVIFKGMNLRGADLQGADLRGADLRGANLRGANLQNAYLQGADLQGADLRDADLQGANLQGADLWGANLCDANLQGADLQDIRTNYLTIGISLSCPETGGFYAYKKVKTRTGNAVVKLYIPAKAKRSSATTKKCRAEYVKVISGEGYTNSHGPRTVYRKGAIIKANKWDNNRWNECSNGIHFFMNKADAESWYT